MAGHERDATAALRRLAALSADPTRYHLFMALRLIEAAHPGRPRLGRSSRPAEDPVRIGQPPEMAFPPSTVAGYAPARGGRPAALSQRLLGVFGPNGPLPLHLTEYARSRQRNHADPTFAAFADAFHHRMAGLLYRAWASAEPAPAADRPEDDDFGRRLDALSGHAGAALGNRDAMPDLARRHFTGLLAAGPRHAEGLTAILGAFFRVPAHVESFVGGWLELEPEDRWRLGTGTLGSSTPIGARVWSREAAFRIRLGPMPLSDYLRLLPGGDSFRRLVATVRAYAGDVLDWEANLVLAAGEVPETRLGRAGALGHTAWIGRRPGGDADDLSLRPSAAATRRAPAA
jgi:type VI secretion system protein ImpH